MASADDLILVYERRLADFEARLAAIEKGPSAAAAASAAPAPVDAAPAATGLASTSAAPSPTCCCSTRSDARLFTAKVPSTPEQLLDRRVERHREDLSRGGHRSDRNRRRDARHDGRDQHGADQGRRAGRPRHHQGLPRRAADRALLRAGRPRRLGHLQQAAAAGAARD